MTAMAALGLALAWLSWTLVLQDREIAARRVTEQLGNAADLAVAAVSRSVTTIEERLATIAEASEPARIVATSELVAGNVSDAVVVVMTSSDTWSSTPLLYYPRPAVAEDAAAGHFLTGERLEFTDGRLAEAVSLFQALASSRDPAVRAGALARLGRVWRKLNRPRAALDAYQQLGRLDTTLALARPAALVAALERCAILTETGDAAARASEAAELGKALAAGRWQLSRPQRALYRSRAEACGGTSAAAAPADVTDVREVLAAGVHEAWAETLSANAGSGEKGRQLLSDGVGGLVVWRKGQRGVAALVATSDHMMAAWRADLASVEERHAVKVVVSDDVRAWSEATTAGDGVERPARATGLPITLGVVNRDPAAAARAATPDRRTLIGILAAVAAVVLLGGYLSARGLARELAALRLQSDFVSAVSHEFRTPVASVRQLSEMLDEGRTTDEARRKEYYGLLRRESVRLQRLVENLLDFGRMEAGGTEYRMEPLDVESFVTGVVSDFRAEARLAGRHVALALHDPLPAIQADREALTRAIWNLLDNAVKYSPAGEPVAVDVGAVTAGVEIRVRDHGCGISASDKERIFDKFVRGAGARSSGAKGTGLGLAMVRHIVSAHGGDVRVESEPGAGATFTITLATGGASAPSVERRAFA